MTLASGVEQPLAEITRICRRYQVKELPVFGSAARGGLRPESDIDLLVEFDPGARLGLLKYSALMRELSTVPGRKVDLGGKAGLKPLVRPEVLAEAVVRDRGTARGNLAGRRWHARYTTPGRGRIYSTPTLVWPIVWAAATEDAPALRRQIAEILRGECSE